jgi:hypothetical protein
MVEAEVIPVAIRYPENEHAEKPSGFRVKPGMTKKLPEPSFI